MNLTLNPPIKEKIIDKFYSVGEDYLSIKRFKNKEWLVYVHQNDDRMTIESYLKYLKSEIIYKEINFSGKTLKCLIIPKKEILNRIRMSEEYHYNVIFYKEIDYNASWRMLSLKETII